MPTRVFPLPGFTWVMSMHLVKPSWTMDTGGDLTDVAGDKGRPKIKAGLKLDPNQIPKGSSLLRYPAGCNTAVYLGT